MRFRKIKNVRYTRAGLHCGGYGGVAESTVRTDAKPDTVNVMTLN
jgi:hypothetical protein